MSGKRSVWMRRPIPKPSLLRYSAATAGSWRSKQSISASPAGRRPTVSDSPKETASFRPAPIISIACPTCQASAARPRPSSRERKRLASSSTTSPASPSRSLSTIQVENVV